MTVPPISYHTSFPPLPSQQPLTASSNALNGHTLGGHTIQPAAPPASAGSSTGETKKKKRKKWGPPLPPCPPLYPAADVHDRSDASSKPFPTPYHFASTEESEALARRAARFSKAGTASASSSVGPVANLGVSDWFDGGESGGVGLVPGAGVGGKKRLRGKGGLGYGGEEVMEVDPVRL